MPWNYFSIEQKLEKSDLKFRENDDIDKCVQDTI